MKKKNINLTINRSRKTPIISRSIAKIVKALFFNPAQTAMYLRHRQMFRKII